MKRCKFFLSPNGFKCGSYAFNLDEQGIDQGEFCDVHYWQNRCEKAEAAALTQPAAADEAISRPCARCDTWSNCQIDDRCAETGVRVDVPCPTKATP